MASSSTIYTIGAGDVGKTVFDLTFEGATANPPGYLDEDHIYMWVNDVQVTVGGGSAEYDSSGVTFVFTTDTSVTVTGYAGVLDDKVEFRRTMPIDKPIIDFVDGAGLTESDLDKLALENLYRVHEIQDGFGTGTQDYYALAKLYANGDEDYEVETGQYSSKHFSIKAAASAAAAAADAVDTAADAAATAADVITTNADAASTAADAIATAADAVSTASDAADTAADLIQTNLDQIDCAANQVLTAADVVLTNADVVLTHADVVSTNADAASTAQDAIDTAADVVTTNADVVLAAASEALAEKWAEEDENTEVEAGKYSAKHWAAKAADGAASFLVSEHTATALQRTFVHTITVTNETVSLNGVILSEDDYSVSTTNVVLDVGASLGDIVRISTVGPVVAMEDWWHADNDGTGSGLDADLLDGVEGANYLRSDVADNVSGNLTFANTASILMRTSAGSGKTVMDMSGSDDLIIGHADVPLDLKGADAAPTYNTYDIWHEGNDGHNSGLDADTLDGNHSSSYIRSDDDSALASDNALDIGSGNGSIRIKHTAASSRTWIAPVESGSYNYGKEISFDAAIGRWAIEGGLELNAYTYQTGGGVVLSNNVGVLAKEVGGTTYPALKMSTSDELELGHVDVPLLLKGSSVEVPNGDLTVGSSNDLVTLNDSGFVDVCDSAGFARVHFKDLGASEFDCKIQQNSDGLDIWTGGNGSGAKGLTISSSQDVAVPNGDLTVDGALLAGPNAVTTAGSSGDVDYWTKIATLTLTGNYTDGAVQLAIMDAKSGEHASCNIIVKVRQSLAGGTTFGGDAGIYFGAISGGDLPAFKMVSAGYNQDIELWMQKTGQYNWFTVTELSRNDVNGLEIEYHSDASWSTPEPTDTYNVSSTAPVSGSFTTTDGKTITITNGMVTAIV